MSSKTELARWMSQKRVFATHDIMMWGVKNFSNRADRNKRDFVEQGLISKISPFFKKVRGYECKDDVYEVNQRAMREYLNPSLFKI